MDKVEALSLAWAAVRAVREPQTLTPDVRRVLLSRGPELEAWLSDLAQQWDAG